jgi:hypothetical protein
MKSLFYFLFGIIVALYAFVILFNVCGPIYLDDYYMDKLVTNYSNEWYYTNLSISAIALFFTIVWIYNLGRDTNHEKEPLLTKKEENE